MTDGESIVLERPPLTLVWATSTYEAVSRALGRMAIELHPVHGASCEIHDASCFGVEGDATIRFDPRGALLGLTLRPRGDGEQSDYDDQVRRRAPAIRERRAALERHLASGVAEPVRKSPVPPMRWHVGATIVLHDVYFAVERGDDPYGSLDDIIRIELRR